MRTSIAKAAALAAIVLVVAGGAAAWSIDSETVDTATTSDITESTVVHEPLNSSKSNEIAVIGSEAVNDSTLTNPETAFTLQFVVNDTSSDQHGEVLYETDKNWTATAKTGAPDYYNMSVQNDKWGEELEYSPGTNVSVDARIIFNESESDESIFNITYEVNANGTTARAMLDSDETEMENQSVLGMSVPFLAGGDGPGAAKSTDNVTTSGNVTTVEMVVDDSDAVDAFSEVADKGSTDSLSAYSYLSVNDQTVPVFVESADDVEWLDTSSDAYATVSSDGQTVTVHNVDKTYDDGTNSIEITAYGNDAVGFSRTQSMLSSYDAGFTTRISAASGAIDINGDPWEEADS